MRIPLDYYRILGLPLQASQEQLDQAYRDRTAQLPRREYSDAAITARKQLLAAAYTVLSDPRERSRYDNSYLADIYNSEATQPTEAQAKSEQLAIAIDPHTPSIEITAEQFAGALLILQELGEYELVVKLGRQYLNSGTGTNSNNSESNPALPDIVLTLALACLELGREQWQQNGYENAATSLEHGQELLLRENLFLNVQAEIKADLDKLRPYRILELLVQQLENVAQRQQGLHLLQQLLQARGGIDGTGEDGSGLELDDFLRFIQQIRSYLTVTEQQNLFESQQPPSAVSTYLVVYALIARGFTQRTPSLISRAKLLLLRLSQHQDLYLEQAVCSLLLGQTAQVSSTLEQSHEYETLAFIREHSHNSPDLLPGLCLYTERWLQSEVFPHFRDLVQSQAVLKDYFAEREVQAYLEALPVETSATVTEATENQSDAESLESTNRRSLKQRVQDKLPIPSPHHVNTTTTSGSSLADVPSVSTASRISAHEPPSDNYQPRRIKRPRRNRSGVIAPRQTGLRHRLANLTRQQLIGLVIAVVLGLAALGFLIRYILVPSSQKQPLSALPPTQTPSPIPTPTINPLVTGLLTPPQAQVVIQTWLSTKAAALGPSHAVDQLKQILVNPALSEWQQLAQNNKADNQYLKYDERGIKVNSVKTTQASPDKAQVEATINEAAQVYQNGKLNRDLSYDKSLQVRYHLVRQNGQWRIEEINS